MFYGASQCPYEHHETLQQHALHWCRCPYEHNEKLLPIGAGGRHDEALLFRVASAARSPGCHRSAPSCGQRPRSPRQHALASHVPWVHVSQSAVILGALFWVHLVHLLFITNMPWPATYLVGARVSLHHLVLLCLECKQFSPCISCMFGDLLLLLNMP